jgi:hypothetical protein
MSTGALYANTRRIAWAPLLSRTFAEGSGVGRGVFVRRGGGNRREIRRLGEGLSRASLRSRPREKVADGKTFGPVVEIGAVEAGSVHE